MEQDRQTTNRKLLKYTIIFLVAIFIIWLGYTIYHNSVFRIVNTDPAVGGVTVVSPFFKVNFNKDLSNSISAKAQPDIINNYKVQGKQLTINLKIPLNPNQTYTIYVQSIYDTKSQHIADQKFVFKPQQVNSALPSNQNQALLQQQTNYSQSVENNQFLQLLPFTGPNFEYRVDYNVTYAGQSEQTIIVITAPSPAAQQDAVSWIKSQGVDPSTLTIQYVTAQP